MKTFIVTRSVHRAMEEKWFNECMEKIRQEEWLISQQLEPSTNLRTTASTENQFRGSEVIDEDNGEIIQDISPTTAVQTSTIKVNINRDRVKDDRMFMKVKTTPFNVYLPKFSNIKHK